MSDAATKAELADGPLPSTKAKRGRKPKIRHDAETVLAPVDGDYDKLSLENEEPGFQYFRLNAKDLARYKRYGIEECRWGVDKVRPREWFGEGKHGDVIRMEELTICKLPIAVAQRVAAADSRRRRHESLMGRMAEHAKSGNGTFEKSQTSIQLPV